MLEIKSPKPQILKRKKANAYDSYPLLALPFAKKGKTNEDWVGTTIYIGYIGILLVL